MAEKGYAGRIAQTGSQKVKAPGQIAPKKSGGKVKKGEDLRTGKDRIRGRICHRPAGRSYRNESTCLSLR